MPINQTVPSGDYEFDFESRITGGDFTEEDGENELSLRPKTLDEYVGQEKVKENLSVFINAAKIRGDALDHVLLHGPPGLGKTTLSCIIASELGVNLKITSGPAIEKAGDLASLLTTLERGDILFIDEIHIIAGAGAAEDLLRRGGIVFHSVAKTPKTSPRARQGEVHSVRILPGHVHRTLRPPWTFRWAANQKRPRGLMRAALPLRARR